MNKTAAGKFLSKVISNNSPGSLIPIKGPLEDLLRRGGYPHVVKFKFIKVDFFKVAGRKVKMMGFCSDIPSMRKCYPISKKKLIDTAYPPKIKNLASYHRQQVLNTARRVINNQIEEFKKDWDEKAKQYLINRDYTNYSEFTKCAISGVNLDAVQRTAVDHKVPFIKLFEDWMEENNLSPEKIQLKGYNKGFKDTSLQNSWEHYHRKNAELQMTESSANRRKSDSGR
jgi:hypothetical protein